MLISGDRCIQTNSAGADGYRLSEKRRERVTWKLLETAAFLVSCLTNSVSSMRTGSNESEFLKTFHYKKEYLKTAFFLDLFPRRTLPKKNAKKTNKRRQHGLFECDKQNMVA